jgi:uncharacterized repeat protein (TIGR03803 family)
MNPDRSRVKVRVKTTVDVAPFREIATELRGCWMFILVPVLLVALSQIARSQTEKVLYSFCSTTSCADGSYPASNLIPDVSGNFYGTTTSGGNFTANCPSTGCGTLFEVSKTGAETILYKFSGIPGGAFPSGNLVQDADGNFYGTTQAGGNTSGACPSIGCGTVFELIKSGDTYTEKVLYAFSAATATDPDGTQPALGVVRDDNGNLYGTLSGLPPPNCAASAVGCGLVFKITSAGEEEVLYRFEGKGDGAYPQAPLVLDSKGNLYGTTANGGSFAGPCATYGCGTLFRITPAGKEEMLYRFKGLPDGRMPMGPVVLGSNGSLFGTTWTGGDTTNIRCSIQASGCGVVFEWKPSGGMSVFYSFKGGLKDGQSPIAGLLLDSHGGLFGTTSAGGSYGRGTVFKVASTGVETVLHSFKGVPDGFSSRSSPLLDVAGNLYGTTIYGGANDDGTLFRVTP